MDILGKRIKYQREKLKEQDNKYTQGYVAEIIGVARSTYTAYENGTKQPPVETINKIADLFNVSTDYLQGRTNDSTPPQKFINGETGQKEKDEKDIAKRMEEIKRDLTSEDGLLFNGEPMSEEAVESFLEAMEYAIRQTQRINKKYIPKKYREDNNE